MPEGAGPVVEAAGRAGSVCQSLNARNKAKTVKHPPKSQEWSFSARWVLAGCVAQEQWRVWSSSRWWLKFNVCCQVTVRTVWWLNSSLPCAWASAELSSVAPAAASVGNPLGHGHCPTCKRSEKVPGWGGYGSALQRDSAEELSEELSVVCCFLSPD